MIRVIVVDDEQPSLDKLEKLLRDSGRAEVIWTFTEPLKALAFIKENEVDAVFLDIEMPDMNGIELASRLIDLNRKIDVVFVTAYNLYAVEAFRLNALDYLMKPISAQRLCEALNRIAEGTATNPTDSAQRNPLLQIRCFGRFSVCDRGQEVKFRTEKAEELLAYLIDNRGGYVSRSKIMDNLWEDFEGDRAVMHFNTTLYNVKKALMQYEIPLSILYDRGSYRLVMDNLSMDRLDCDYIKFCEFVESDRAIGADTLEEYEQMAELYTGEYLSGCEYDWAAGRRLLLEEEYIRLLLTIALYYKETGSYEKAAKGLKTGLLQAPLHRGLNYSLIEVLLLTNERSLAARYYDIYKKGLMKKLQQEPDEAFNKLLR